MKKNILLVISQPLLLIFLLFYALLPIYFGREIWVEAKIYDPRDLFRGDYVALRYDFNDMKYEANINNGVFKIYAILKPDENGTYKTDDLSVKKPNNGVFLAGKKFYDAQNFGVEAYYLTRENALKIDKMSRDNKFKILARLKVDSDGNARIDGLKLIENNKTNPEILEF